jgi:uncharacterized protein YukE
MTEIKAVAGEVSGNITESKEKVDRVRDILFGSYVRDYGQKFDRLNQELMRLNQEMERLQEQLREQDKRQIQQLQSAEQRLVQAIYDLDARHTEQAQQLGVRMQSTERVVFDEVSRLSNQLNHSKADRTLLADLLIELGTNLKTTDPAPLPPSVDWLDQLSEEL